MRLAVAEQAGATWSKAIGAPGLSALRAMPAEELLTASRRERLGSRPVADGWAVPGDLYALYRAGRYNDVHVLIGYNSDEGATFGAPGSQKEYVDRVRQRYGPFADKILAVYPGGDTPAEKRTARDLMRDTAFGWHTWTWARLQSQTGQSNVFLYYFDEPFPPDATPPGYGTPHAEELPYVFRQLTEHKRPPPTPRDEALSEAMRTYWTNFAKSGNPNGPGLPAWPPFSDAAPQMLYIASGRTGTGPIVNQAGLGVLDEYFAWRRTMPMPSSTVR
jgi:para-nitrobenzyl esterase